MRPYSTLLVAHGFGLEKCHLPWRRASESASDMRSCEYHASKHAVFYFMPDISHRGHRASSVTNGDSNSCPLDQEQWALTKELASWLQFSGSRMESLRGPFCTVGCASVMHSTMQCSILSRGHLCRKPNPMGLPRFDRAHSSVPPGFQLMSSRSEFRSKAFYSNHGVASSWDWLGLSTPSSFLLGLWFFSLFLSS